MIAVKLEGRLGNQLFQYAFIYAAAKKLNTNFYIDKSVDNFIPAKYFTLKNDFIEPIDKYIFSIQGFKNIFKIHLKKSFYNLLFKVIFNHKKIIVSNNASATNVLEQLRNNLLYEGYFQSESYFKNAIADIKALYQIKHEHITAFKNVQEQLPFALKKAVIHIRRGDYVTEDIALPLSYYKNAIASVDSHNLFYIFISDDPQFIEQEFGYLANKYISTHNEIIDLQFLINADICILSSSSFSWWGAWLNNNPHKQLLAPKYWLGLKEKQEYPTGISYDMNFTLIEA